MPDSLEHSTTASPAAPSWSPLLVLRGVIGGVLMGLANLVPGVSGGTMLLAAGVYPGFIASIADVTTFKLRPRSIALLGSIAGSAALAILLLAGPIKDLVVNERWIMYSLFIGLTLGGLPLVWRMAQPIDRRFLIGGVIGMAGMVGLAVAQTQSVGASAAGSSNFVLLIVAGLAGASAMILPGVSGGYLLLLLGQYVPILSGIERFVDALRARDLDAAMGPAIQVLLPVGLGVLIGVVAVSNAVRFLLERHRMATLGFLTGLLLGAVVGLWPYQRSVEPILGETQIKGVTVTADNVGDFDAEDYPTELFRPTGVQIALGVLIIGAGLSATVLLSRLQKEPDSATI